MAERDGDDADPLTRTRAREQAARIEAYWKARGLANVRAWVEEFVPDHSNANYRGGRWVVRSNLPQLLAVRPNG